MRTLIVPRWRMPSPYQPFLTLDAGGEPLCQLKLSYVLYLDYPPGPKRAGRVVEAYMARFGQHVREYQPTSWLGPAWKWDPAARSAFPGRLAELQKTVDWGYGFGDGTLVNNHLFMFHGYKPVTESGKASFFRFEWPWDTAADVVAPFVKEVADLVPFLSGNAGYILSTRPFDPEAHDHMYAVARRYWGIEAWNLDSTVKYVLEGYKCPTWLTLIGDRLLEKISTRGTLETALHLATRCATGTIFRTRQEPAFIDRNRVENYDNEKRVAEALLPLQIRTHEPFGGTRWTPETTLEWLYRFTT
ncbi:MAG: type VI immunity family protein [Myxococcales bacterium]